MPADSAPALTHLSTTAITTTGRTALTYTGYMNGESFQQHGITTFGEWQYTAFWDEAGHVNLARRRLPAGAWQNLQLTDYTTVSTDSHNVISIGIAAEDGTIHVAFDTHSSPLRYRRSAPGLAAAGTDPADWSLDRFGPVRCTLADTDLSTDLSVVTYPRFINAPDGRFQLAIRTGYSGSGDEVLYEYAEGEWVCLGPFINGTAAGNNAYLFGIGYDDVGRLHTTWTVRETPDPSTNHDLYYAYSDDRGRTWRTNTGSPVARAGIAPLLADSPALKVWSIGPNRGLMNQESQIVDSTGTVHVLASHLPWPAETTAAAETGFAAAETDFAVARERAVLVHYWRDPATAVWSRTSTPFREGSARSDLAVDADDNLYVAGGNSLTRQLHIETASRASGWTDWTNRHTSAAIYYSDPLIDHERLRSLGTLSVFAPRHGGSQIDVQDWSVTT